MGLRKVKLPRLLRSERPWRVHATTSGTSSTTLELEMGVCASGYMLCNIGIHNILRYTVDCTPRFGAPRIHQSWAQGGDKEARTNEPQLSVKHLTSELVT